MCAPLLAGLPAAGGALGGASGIFSAAMTGLGIASQFMAAQGANKAISQQQGQLSDQASRAYAENAMRRSQADRNAAQEGYQASRESEKAVSRAIVRNTSLGISGVTAGEMVGEEVTAGSYNVASAIEQSRDARGAELVSNRHTYSDVMQRHSSMESQRPGMVTTLFGMATGGLEGYLLGDRIDTARGTKR